MKVKLTQASAVVALTAMAVSAHAEPIPEWANSYAANDQCYCVQEPDRSLINKIVPTPIGGQSVGQICGRVGAGPELTLTNGEFNYPTYGDAQCGNGPEPATVSNDFATCLGRMTEDDSVCTGTGPAWDLVAIYASPAEQTPVEETQVTISEPAQEIVPTEQIEITQQIEPDDIVPTEPVTTTATATESSLEELPLATIVESTSVATIPEVTVVAEEVVEPAPVIQPKPAPVIRKAEVESPAEPALAVDREDSKAEAKRLAAELVDEKEEERRIESAQLPSTVDPVDANKTTEEADAVAASSEESPVLAEQEKQQAAEEVVVASEERAASASPAPALKLPFPDEPNYYAKHYVQIAPTDYDFGGTGGAVEGSLRASSNLNFIGRASVVEEYSEYMLGIGIGFSPAALRGARVAFEVGVEHGEFDLSTPALAAELADTGGVIASSIGYNINRWFGLQGGVSYSSFFEGDPSVFGLLLFHVNRNIDIASRAEGGDNDNVSLGIRFNY